MKLLPKKFFERDTLLVARELLGNYIIRIIDGVILKGMIVETEAYYKDDPACHAHRGKTKSNEALFGPVGHAYVYFIYGNYYCLNFVARDPSCEAGGVLIRALEPIEGIEYMQKLRKKELITQLTSGPGKLAQALAITKALIGTDITKKGPLYVVEGQGELSAQEIIAAKRIGISKAQEHDWRFYIKNNPYISKK